MHFNEQALVLSSVAAAIERRLTSITNMEVADQWRRKWSGTAEYGKVSFCQSGLFKSCVEALHAPEVPKAFLLCKDKLSLCLLKIFLQSIIHQLIAFSEINTGSSKTCCLH